VESNLKPNINAFIDQLISTKYTKGRLLMFKRICSKIMLMIVVLGIAVSSFGIIAIADGGPGKGWTPVVDQKSPLGDTRIVVSPTHYGWCAPGISAQHVNLILYVNGVESANYHIFAQKTASGKSCLKAFETKSWKYYSFSKCYDDTNAAMKEILESNGQYSLADKVKSALPYAIAVVVIAWIIKIILSIVLANPAPLLIPV